MKNDSLSEILARKKEHFEKELATARTPEERFRCAEEIRSIDAQLQSSAEPLVPDSRRVDFTRIDRTVSGGFIGRREQCEVLDHAWKTAHGSASPRVNIVCIVGLGGEGKTALVAQWVATLRASLRYGFAWSFKGQGEEERTTQSADVFIDSALRHFGAAGEASAAANHRDKAATLSRLASGCRALLVLDGVEPMQYPPASAQAGRLKDEGLSTLLRMLAMTNRGLCVVTTQYPLTDLGNYAGSSVLELALPSLTLNEGEELLRSRGVLGRSVELKTLVQRLRGHALTIHLIGTYIRQAFNGDVRKQDCLDLSEVDEETGGSCRAVMAAYAEWFLSAGERGARALGVLYVLGLFDRRAAAECFEVLVRGSPICEVTRAISAADEVARNSAYSWLEDARLIATTRDETGRLLTIDAHPLVREYFGRKLHRECGEGWRDGHSRLFDHFVTGTDEGEQPDLRQLEPLLQAVAHGCNAARYRDACNLVLFKRIYRGCSYSTQTLGAFGATLEALGGFFERLWVTVVEDLEEPDRAWVLGCAAYCLRGLGRLREARDAARAAMQMYEQLAEPKQASIQARNLSEVDLLLGHIEYAVEDARYSIVLAQQSKNVEQETLNVLTLADALSQGGDFEEALGHFRVAEQARASSSEFPLLRAVQNFRYCEVLLRPVEELAWKLSMGVGDGRRVGSLDDLTSNHEAVATCGALQERAARVLAQDETSNRPLDISMTHLIMGRVSLYQALLQPADRTTWLSRAAEHIEEAVSGLRRSGEHHLPRGLMSRAWLQSLKNESESAIHDLDEAWEVAVRGGMLLFQADIRLYRARLFLRSSPYPWGAGGEGAHHDLQNAEMVIKQGYLRRERELTHAKAMVADVAGGTDPA